MPVSFCFAAVYVHTVFEFLEKQEELAKARQASSSSSSSSMASASSSSSPTTSLPPLTSSSFTSSPGATSSSSGREDQDRLQGASQSTGRGGEREQPCSSTSSSSLCSSVAREDRNTRTSHESHNKEADKGELRNPSTSFSNWREGVSGRADDTGRETTSHMSSGGRRSETSASCSSQEGRLSSSPTSYENPAEVEKRRVSSSSSVLGKRNGGSGADGGGVRSEGTQVENPRGGESDDRRETEGQSPPRLNLRELREKRLKALEQKFEK